MTARLGMTELRHMFWMFALAGVGLCRAGSAEAVDRKPLNVATEPGRAFVASLQFHEAHIEAVEPSRVTCLEAGEKKPRLLRRGTFKVFDEESVSDAPLQFIDDPHLDVHETVRVAHVGPRVYVMRPRGSNATQHSVPSTTSEPDERATHIPTLEEVKLVLKLDTEEKQREFEKLDDATRRELLIAAGNIAGVKDVPHKVSIRKLNENIQFFERRKIRDWLLGLADDAGGDKLVHALKTPRGKWETVKMAFAGLSPDDQKTAKTVAVKLRSRGASGLSRDESQFIARYPLIFGNR